MDTILGFGGIWLPMAAAIFIGAAVVWFGMFIDALTKKKEGRFGLVFVVIFPFLLGPINQTAQAAAPDLTLTDLSATRPKTAIGPGTVLPVSTTVQNVGDSPASSFVISFHLSTDGSYGGGDDVPFAATRTVNSLIAGASSKEMTKITIPLNTPVGTYHLCVMVDSGDAVSESNEANNSYCTTDTGEVKKSDLVPTAVTPAVATVSSTATLSVTNTVQNQGDIPAGSFIISFVLSPSPSYNGLGAQYISTTRKVTSLAVGARSTAATKLSIPLSTPGGSYYVCVKADSADTVGEKDETNNTQCSPGTVTVPAADLVLMGIGVTPVPKAIGPGTVLPVSSIVQNLGGFPTGGFVILFHLSTDGAYGGGDDVVFIADGPVRSLKAGGISKVTTKVTIPHDTPVGTYHLCAMVDGDDDVAEESDEGNNTFCTPETIDVNKSDLVPTAVTPVTNTVSSTGALSVTNTVKNQGAIPAGSFIMVFVLSPNPSYADPGAVAIPTTRKVGSLAAGASSTAATKLAIPFSTLAGPYYVCIKADSADLVGELDETNNTQCSPGTVTVPVHSVTPTTKITTTVVGTSDAEAYALVTQPSDGKLVTAGYSYDDSKSVFALVRYNTNGSPDTTFGSKGIVTTDLGGVEATAYAIAVQPSDGKLVAAGYSHDGSKYVFALVRYNTNGSLDTDFGSGGIVTTDIGGVESTAYTVAVQPLDGKLVVAGYSTDGGQNVFAVARYNTDGSLDAVFNPAGTIPGVVTKAIGTSKDRAFALTVQPDGNLVAAGYSYNSSTSANEIALARFNGTDGSLDTTFNSGGTIPGVVTMAIGVHDDRAYAIAIQPSDGKLVAAGYSYDNALAQNVFALARFNTDGSLDTTFNFTGAVPGAATAAFGDIDDEVNALAVQSDGKLVAAGYSDTNSQYVFALARFNTDGTLDMTFNGTDKITTVVGGDDAAYSVGIQPDENWVTTGYSLNETKGIYLFAVVRYGF